MAKTINYGIDLGTTNSAISKFVKGTVEIYKDPVSWKETIPSVIGFKKDKCFIGTKAKEFAVKRPHDVKSLFKRKMGTSESLKVRSLDKSYTPIELSSFVLKELKNFIPKGEKLDAAVITIPASFDTIQSNATKEAGLQAGLKQVLLLQEPIAASLAYANKTKQIDLTNGKWLVYDLGGGTFDVALLSVEDGELKVIDNEGNNFLGGTDFDRLIVENIIIPELEENYQFTNLKQDLQDEEGKYNGKYCSLIGKAEDAKKELSSKTSAEIEIEMEDDAGVVIDEEFTITRTEFNKLIQKMVDSTIDMIKKILVRNSLNSNDINFTLMIGGSTYIPYIRERVEDILQIPIRCDIDPTTAVAVGAAYYAGEKTLELDLCKHEEKNYSINVKMAYAKTSREEEELLSVRINGDYKGLNYRIIREDKGFDSGLKELKDRFSEDLPLVKDSYNYFTFQIYDRLNNIIETNAELIGITQGKYSVSGQTLPNDISLEVDEIEDGGTKLHLLFSKNSILPLVKSDLSRTINKKIRKGTDDALVINIVEGPHTVLPEANYNIGFMEIRGTEINRDILAGADIEFSFDMSESRDLTVSAYIPMLDQEFKYIFNQKERHVPVDWLQEETEDLSSKIDIEIQEASDREDYETAEELAKIKKTANEILEVANDISISDTTDKRYQLEDRKRKLAQELDKLTKDKHIEELRATYLQQKEDCLGIIYSDGNDHEKEQFDNIVAQEVVFLKSNSALKIKEKTEELSSIYYAILFRTPDFLKSMFGRLKNEIHRMNDTYQAKNYITLGNNAIQELDWDKLREVISGLMNLLPKSLHKEVQTKIGF